MRPPDEHGEGRHPTKEAPRNAAADVLHSISQWTDCPCGCPAGVDCVTELPSRTDLAIRRHLDAVLELLRPRCAKCSRPLSAPESLRIGIGPECRKGEAE